MKSRSDVDKPMGMMFGLAVGDALGRPTEFMSLENIQSKYGPEGIQDLPEQALYTDDTQMTIAIAEALIKTGDQDLETIVPELAVRGQVLPLHVGVDRHLCNFASTGRADEVDRHRPALLLQQLLRLVGDLDLHPANLRAVRRQ